VCSNLENCISVLFKMLDVRHGGMASMDFGVRTFLLPWDLFAWHSGGRMRIVKRNVVLQLISVVAEISNWLPENRILRLLDLSV
jgi:hypothetical protein